MMEKYSIFTILGAAVKVIIYVLVSWVLVHVLAVFGLFIAVTYPIWWLLAPSLSVCFTCRSKGEGEYCNLCRSSIEKSRGYHPKNFRSAAINTSNIFLVTIISLVVIYGEYTLLKTAGVLTNETERTVSFVIPSKGQFKIGEIFPVKIEISGIEIPINAVQADLGFNPDKVEVVDVSIKESFAKVFIQKQINNEIGYVRLTGGLQSPGFAEKAGTLGTVFFRAKESGLVQMKFLTTSLVLANDGVGTNVIKDYPEANYLVINERLSRDEIELQESLLSTNVLGVDEEDDDKIIFFNNDESVLGATDSIEDGSLEESNDNGADFLLNIIKEIDYFILTMYEVILSFFGVEISLK